MKRLFLFFGLVGCSFAANAVIGVAMGHKKWADDGFPWIEPGEQVSVFYCKGKMSGPEAQACAVKKCVKRFKRQALCKEDGWAQRKGYAILVVGPKGDNQYIYSKAIGDPTREVAMEYVRSNNFPVNRSRIVLDIYDEEEYAGLKTRGGVTSQEPQSSIVRPK